jgi:hypothetical protein
METSEKTIPNYIYEDLLFQRRLQRNLNVELEKLKSLLAEQVRLLEERKALMVEVHEAVQRRWEEEEMAEPRPHSATATEEHGHGE